MLLIAADRGVERVACACEVAHSAGVRCGMTVAHARSLLAERRVKVAPHNPEEVARALDRMVQWAFRFSPVVTADYPDGLLLDISGCAHLYAGEERLAKSIVWELEQWRFPSRVCVGPTAGVARAVARYSGERITIIPDHAGGDELRFLPVSALGVEPAIRDDLAEIGVMNIDQLLNLPREELAPRFGAALLSRMDQALGLAHELIQPVKCIEPVELKRTFEGAITNQEAILLAVEQLLREMVSRLASEESGVSRMSIQFFRIEEEKVQSSKFKVQKRHADRPIGPNENSPAFQRWDKEVNQIKVPAGRLNSSIVPSGLNFSATDDTAINPRAIFDASLRDAKSGTINLSLSFPSRDFRHLWSLLRPKLERVHLGYGVEEIILRVLQRQRLSHTQLELWPDAALPRHAEDHAVMGQWLDQVIERLGRHAVVEMKLVERYLPEESFSPKIVLQAEGRSQSQKTSSKFDPGAPGRNSRKEVYPAVRPSKLFSPPEHARIIALIPDGPPAWIQWQGKEERVACGYGPERICGPWWNEVERHGGIPARRDLAPARRHEGEMRDYFVVQTEAGIWLWVFRDCQTAEWYVHGEWA